MPLDLMGIFTESLLIMGSATTALILVIWWTETKLGERKKRDDE